MSTEFFELLYNDEDFCKALGKVMLAASRLEFALGAYLDTKGVKVPERNVTLGTLINKLKAHNLLTNSGEMAFDDLKLKRNYLAHNLYNLFSGSIEETILPKTGLIESDVTLFSEKAELLANELSDFTGIVYREIGKNDRPNQVAQQSVRLL